jgi:hypothetical protein
MVDDGVADDVDAGGFEWRCEHCGERTPKNNPPCSNCGGMAMEKAPLDAERDVREAESLAGTPRRTVLGYGAAGVAVVVGGGYFIWDALTPPAIPDAPGNGESAGGISLEAAADAILTGVNDARAEALGEVDRVQSAARYATAYTVVEGDAGSARELFRRLDEFRIGRFQFVRRVITGDADVRGIETFADAEDLAGAVVDSLLGDDDVRAVLVNDRFANGGVDVRVDPEGDVYVAVVVATGGDGFL